MARTLTRFRVRGFTALFVLLCALPLKAQEAGCDNCANDQRLVTGIGGFFFRSKDPEKLAAWYLKAFDINPAPQSYEDLPWTQGAGYTVFSAFPDDSDYFGDADKQWMINFRVSDLDALIEKLRRQGTEVSDPQTYPNGRFARTADPEGNPIQLWEPGS